MRKHQLTTAAAGGVIAAVVAHATIHGAGNVYTA
jgi:hypothetical protein